MDESSRDLKLKKLSVMLKLQCQTSIITENGRVRACVRAHALEPMWLQDQADVDGKMQKATWMM